MLTTAQRKRYSEMAPRELREARNLFIVTRLTETPKENLADAMEDLADKFGITAQSVRLIAEKAGIISRKQHSEQAKVRAAIVQRMTRCEPSRRKQFAMVLSQETGYSVLSIRNMCQRAGIHVRRAAEVDKWLKIIGDYRRIKNMAKVAEMNEVTKQRVSQVIKKAEAYGVIEAAGSALRHDPVIREQLSVIDKANRVIEKQLAKRAGGGE